MSMKKISEGAESYIYSAQFLGIDCIVKRRIKKNYRIEEIDQAIRGQRTKNEARIMALVSALEINSPSLLLVDRHDIFMSRIYGLNLNGLLNSCLYDVDKTFSVLGRYLAILHNNNISHGDYTPANVIVDKRGLVYLIDFGLSEVTNSIEDKALDILLMKRSIDEGVFSKFIDAYKEHGKESKSILNRLEDIEKRGRYNTRTILTG
jgi:Kae1-associated kinase Bud32